MAFDPRLEDYQRLALRFSQSSGEMDPYSSVRALANFERRYRDERDTLPQTDADRAFHLVLDASQLVDYELPFAAEEDLQGILLDAQKLLEEALALDPACYDAKRMLSCERIRGFEAAYRFLMDGIDEVRAACEREAALAQQLPGSLRAFARDLAMRPYLRWMAATASRALVCGKYRIAARLCAELLEFDPADSADARFTLAYALVKLEDAEGLDALERLYAARGWRRDAWLMLARLALSYKNDDFEAAQTHLNELMDAYPHAGAVLVRQDELPDGIFSRLAAAPFSEDELVLAVSEGAVFFQEGWAADDQGPLGSWIASNRELMMAAAADTSHRLLDDRDFEWMLP